MTEHEVVSQTGSWDRRKTLEKNRWDRSQGWTGVNNGVVLVPPLLRCTPLRGGVRKRGVGVECAVTPHCLPTSSLNPDAC